MWHASARLPGGKRAARLAGNGRRKVNSWADVPAVVVGIAKFGLSLMTRPRISRYYYYVGVAEVGAGGGGGGGGGGGPCGGH